MHMTTTLAELTTRTGLDVLDHLERQVAILVVDGLRAQGDLIVIPYAFVERHVELTRTRERGTERTGVARGPDDRPLSDVPGRLWAGSRLRAAAGFAALGAALGASGATAAGALAGRFARRGLAPCVAARGGARRLGLRLSRGRARVLLTVRPRTIPMKSSTRSVVSSCGQDSAMRDSGASVTGR
jgi:hypothetical protein